jgi:hypothetical protein
VDAADRRQPTSQLGSTVRRQRRWLNALGFEQFRKPSKQVTIIFQGIGLVVPRRKAALERPKISIKASGVVGCIHDWLLVVGASNSPQNSII